MKIERTGSFGDIKTGSKEDFDGVHGLAVKLTEIDAWKFLLEKFSGTLIGDGRNQFSESEGMVAKDAF